MQTGLLLHPHMANKFWEGYLDYRGCPYGAKHPRPTQTKTPSPEFQCQEEKSLKPLAIKISRD